MIEGVVVGLVVDNVDPDKRHRVKVEYPVQGEGITSVWARIMTPMAGGNRGLVLIPEIGTEVVLGFAYRSLTPYVLGGVYNGGDDPDPYANADGDNNLRLLWTRGDHQVVFDDTAGAESLGIGASAGAMGDVTSGPVHQHLDAANATWNEYSEQDISWEAVNAISIKCLTFSLQASQSVSAEGGQTAVAASGQSCNVNAGTMIQCSASRIDINGGAPGQPGQPLTTPTASHPPTS